MNVTITKFRRHESILTPLMKMMLEPPQRKVHHKRITIISYDRKQAVEHGLYYKHALIVNYASSTLAFAFIV